MLKALLIRSLLACMLVLASGSVWCATVVKLGTVSQIAGPQDLDLDGEIVYAINFSAEDPVRTVRGVEFAPDRQYILGATLTGPQQVTGWQTKPEFGNSADDNQLEEILHDIRWANGGANERLRASFTVTAGQEYKLQILISGNRPEERRWDIRVNGQEAVDEITSLGVSPGESYSPYRATLYTHQFAPATANITVEMGNLFGANDGGDRNALWQALILKRVFTPPTPEDILLEPGVFFANQTNAVSQIRAVDRKSNSSHLFALVPGDGDRDNAKFVLSGNELRAGIDFSLYPVGTAFSVRLRATDAADPARSLEKAIALTIAEPHAPAAVQVDVGSINGRAQVGSKVAEFEVSDPDRFDRHTLFLVDGAGAEHNSLFTLSDRELRLVKPLPAGLNEVRIRLRAVDLANESLEWTFVLPVLAPQLAITELVSGYSASQGIDGQDLIEIRNRLSQWVDLAGWSLSDRENNPRKWQFPGGQIRPNGFFVLVADGSGVTPTGSTNLHTNFSLDSTGEWVGLSDPTGQLINALLVPEFLPNVAYGIGEDGRTGYLLVPTLGKANGAVSEYGANEVTFSKRHGYYEQAFSLELSATVPNSTIRYTIDGSIPTPTTGLVYSGPITITPSTVATTRGVRIVRTIAVNPKAAYARAAVQTYLFINGVTAPGTDGVVTQSRLATTIRNHAVYGPLLDDAFRSLPAMSVLLPTAPNAVEQAASIELFDPENAEEGFQINCGINVTGTSSLGSPKLSMAAKFRAKYGRSKLRYPVFARGSMAPEGAATEFKELRLRSHSHDTFFWLGTRENPPVPYGNPAVTRGGDAQLGRDIWNDEMQLLMGQPGKHGRQVHLYLNGAYHGIYHIHEHADEDFMASYYPGSSEDFHYTGAALAGSEHANGDTWRKSWSALKASLSNYREAQRWVDVTNLCDYMVLSFYAGNDWDWTSQHNWSAAGPNARDRGGWKFFQQDTDVSLQDVNADCTDQDVPDGIFTALMRYPDFRVLFRDRVYKHCYNDGILTRAGEVYDRVMNGIHTAIIAETARWQPSSSVAALPWDRDQEWMNEWNYLRNTFFPQRTQRLIGQLKKHSGWWPVEPPNLNQFGGRVPVGFPLSFTSALGTIYYTFDGSDPRLPGGSVNPGASRANAGDVETRIITKGAVWKFLDNGTAPTSTWTNRGFDDTAWRSGPTEIGYGDGDEATVAKFVDTDPSTVSVEKNITTYFRKTFDLPNFDGIKSMVLRLTRDDGAIVYLNGKEIARSNMPEGLVNSSTPAIANLGGADESTAIESVLNPKDLLLQPTDNILAVEVHQQSQASSDMSFNLELVMVGSGTNVPAVINVPTVVKARVFSGSDWSPLAEAYFVPDNVPPASAANIVISEIQFHPLEENENEFLEFVNTSALPADLSDVTLSDAITFRFPKATMLAPGERIVVAKNLALFEARYRTNSSPYYRDARVTGPWDGSLSNSGERIVVSGPDGSMLFTCIYGTSGAWPGRADGKGSSLELVNPARVPLTTEGKSAWLADPVNWRPSVEFHGSPGIAGDGPDNRIVINEFSPAQYPITDAIELKNITAQEIDLGGWFLSDSSSNYRKYRFPEGTKVAPEAYLVLQSQDFNNTNNPACLIPFGLDIGGEDIYLVQAHSNRELMRFVDRVEYGAAPPGTILGRWPDGTGPIRWLTSATAGGTNAMPVPGYAAWASVSFEPKTPIATKDPAADPDNDGLSNLAEYAFVFSPLRGNAAPLTLVNWQGSDTFAFSFRKRTSAADLKYEVEISTDLASWHSSTEKLEILAETPQPDGSTVMVARFHPSEQSAVSRFVRVVVLP